MRLSGNPTTIFTILLVFLASLLAVGATPVPNRHTEYEIHSHDPPPSRQPGINLHTHPVTVTHHNQQTGELRGTMPVGYHHPPGSTLDYRQLRDHAHVIATQTAAEHGSAPDHPGYNIKVKHRKDANVVTWTATPGAAPAQ